MSMRRRMMMQALMAQDIDYLEGYKLTGTSVYRISAEWNDNSVKLHHRSNGFMGPEFVSIVFASGNAEKQNYKTFGSTNDVYYGSSVYDPFAWSDNEKQYRLTITVIAINVLDYTGSPDGYFQFWVGCGGGIITRSSIVNWSGLEVGQTVELDFARGKNIGINVKGSSSKFDIDFEISIEEVG